MTFKKRKIIIAYNKARICEIRKDAKAESSVEDSAIAITKELSSSKWDTILLPVAPPLEKLVQAVSKIQPDAIFNLCEAFYSNPKMEMNIAALWELLKIPYTGCNPHTLNFCLDKIKTKIIASYYGIKTPSFEIAYRENHKTKLNFPLIIKPPYEDGSIGITSKSFISTPKELQSVIKNILTRYKSPALIEEYIDGRELNVAAFGHKAITILPPAEIIFSNFKKNEPKILCYDAKWNEASSQYKNTASICPANLPKNITTQLKRITLNLYKIFGADSYARADFRMNNDNEIFFLEFNPNPDLSPNAGFRKALIAGKISFANFAETLIKIAIKRTLSQK